MGYWIGWLGVVFGLLVGPAQLFRIIITGEVSGISTFTYTFLCLALVCYLIHAIHIRSKVFIVAQAVNIVVNGIILVMLII